MAKSGITGMEDLASHLPELFGRKNWQLLWQTFSLVRNWPAVAGQEIARHTNPGYIRNNILWIEVRSSVWMQHLQLMKPQLLDRVRRFMPEPDIADIRWVMQTSDPAPGGNQEEKENKRVTDPAEAEAFKQLAATVENKECRNALYKLWMTFHQHR